MLQEDMEARLHEHGAGRERRQAGAVAAGQRRAGLQVRAQHAQQLEERADENRPGREARRGHVARGAPVAAPQVLQEVRQVAGRRWVGPCARETGTSRGTKTLHPNPKH